MEVKHDTSKGLNHEVNLSTGIVIQQEVPRRHILEVGERKLEDKNFEKTMLPEEQELGQERILPENTYSLSDNIQAVCLKTISKLYA